MVTFDDGRTKKLISRISSFSGLSAAAFVIAFCCGTVAACLTADMDKNAALITAFLILCGAGLICFIVAFALTKSTERRLNEVVAEKLAEAMEKNKDLLSGDKKIRLKAAYSGGKLTLSRVNFLKEVTFDLAGIKKSSKIYSDFGTRLTEYLEGFYAVNSKDGYESVTVADCTGKDEEILDIVKDGKPVVKADGNYFIKRGLIK